VPLSDREQRILEEIEKNLYKEDPSFAQGVRRPRLDQGKGIKVGAIVFVAGFALLLGFFVSSSLWVGLLAFGAMVGGIVLVAGSIRSLVADRGGEGGGRRDRVAQAVKKWEERIRQRYKRS
jgi:hypothetical protein